VEYNVEKEHQEYPEVNDEEIQQIKDASEYDLSELSKQQGTRPDQAEDLRRLMLDGRR
jgi:hypothetical protein